MKLAYLVFNSRGKTCLLVAFYLAISFGHRQSHANSAQNCRWVATHGKSVEEIASAVRQKSGRVPTVSCGGGPDYKVCHSCSPRLSKEDWRKLQDMLAEPTFAQWHSGWHADANKFSFEAARQGGPAFNETEHNKVAGENFLFMHRELVRATEANLAAMGLPCFTPWPTLPERADDPVWPTFNVMEARRLEPVCSARKDEQLRVTLFQEEMKKEQDRLFNERLDKEDEAESKAKKDAALDFFQLQDQIMEESAREESEVRMRLLAKHRIDENAVQALRDCASVKSLGDYNAHQSELAQATREHSAPAFLASRSLGEVGSAIEKSWHGGLHSIYGNPQPSHCQSRPEAPDCDDMFAPTTSHKNIHFYQIHGMIDRYIDDWVKANGYESIALNCGEKPKCYQWKGTFASNPPDFIRGTGCSLAQVTTPTSGLRPSAVDGAR